MKEAIFKQFLVSDYDKIGQKTSPNFPMFSNMEDQHGKILKGPFVLQINDIWDIGIPLTEQIDMEKENFKSDDLQDEGDALFSDAIHTEIKGSKPKKNYESSNYSKRLLNFTLSDGHVNNIQAMEYKPINFVSLQTVLGTKVKISNVLVRRGIMLLVPQNIVVLGGGVDELIEVKKVFKSTLAAKRIGRLDLENQIDTTKIKPGSNNIPTSSGSTPPRAQSRSGDIIVKEEDLEDLEFLDEHIVDASSDEDYQDSTKRTKLR